MTKELSQLEVVYNFLVSGNQELYRAKQIYETMPKATKERFKGGINDISKCLTKLKSQGRVENGEIYYDDSQPRLTWRAIIKSEKTEKTDEISTNQPVVNAVAEAVEAESVEVKTYQTEAEREYFDGFAYPKDSTNSFESLIEEAQDTAILTIANVFNGLIEQLHVVKPKHEGIDELIEGLLEVSDLLSEKIAVKNIIPVIEFLRGLK